MQGKEKKVGLSGQLVERLRTRVLKASSGESLGTEVAFAKESGVSRMTARKAVAVLIDEGLIERRAGIGLFAAGARRVPRYGFLSGNLLWDISLKVASGFRRAAVSSGAQVDLMDAQGDSRKLIEQLEALPDSGLSGAVVLSSHDGAFAAAVAGVRARGFPIVVIDQVVDGVPCVVSDNRLGGALAAERLLHAGHKRLAFLGDFVADTVLARWDGFRALCESATGKAPQKCNILGVERFSDWEKDVCAATRRLMQRKEKPTGIFCSCDAVARYAMRTLVELGYDVPGDVSLVGFDDDSIAEWTKPALTTVRQDFMSMGSEAARLLLHHSPATVVTVPVIMVPRVSVANVINKAVSQRA